MTNEQILKKAIEKAVENGYKNHLGLVEIVSDGVWINRDAYTYLETIIFSHDFAEAFWPDGKDIRYCDTWRPRLQEMVLEKDPIKYLEKFVDKSGDN